MIDSRVPRFSQALQAAVLAVAFVFDAPPVVPVMAALLLAAVGGGRGWNLFAHLYRLVPVPPGDLEPAAPPRFAQGLGAVFLAVGTMGLFTAEPGTAPYWVLGWGPALAVAVLAAVAATTSF